MEVIISNLVIFGIAKSAIKFNVVRLN